MLNCLAPLRELSILTMLLRFLLAVGFGSVIGWDRSVRGRSAGLRTHILVCVGAASVMLLSQYLTVSPDCCSDPARLGAQVISGVGFLGAGSIIVTGRQQGQRVHGLTTAAGLWASACMGLLIGAGFYEAAAVMCLILFLVISMMNRIDTKYLKSYSEAQIYIEFAPDTTFAAAIDVIQEQDWHIQNIDPLEGRHLHGDGVLLNIECSRPERDLPKLLEQLRHAEGIVYAQQV